MKTKMIAAMLFGMLSAIAVSAQERSDLVVQEALYRAEAQKLENERRAEQQRIENERRAKEAEKKETPAPAPTPRETPRVKPERERS